MIQKKRRLSGADGNYVYYPPNSGKKRAWAKKASRPRNSASRAALPRLLPMLLNDQAGNQEMSVQPKLKDINYKPVILF